MHGLAWVYQVAIELNRLRMVVRLTKTTLSLKAKTEVVVEAYGMSCGITTTNRRAIRDSLSQQNAIQTLSTYRQTMGRRAAGSTW